MIKIIKEIILRRSLLYQLLIKNLKLQYSRPTLGFFWAILLPLLMVAIFYLVFSLILDVQTKEVPFLLYLMSAIFSWRFFQSSVSASVSCLMDNKYLIKESKFPQYIVPISVVLTAAVNFLPSLFILLVTAAIMLKGLPFFIIALPFIILLHLGVTVGISLIVSVIYIRMRDIKYLLEVLLLALFYLTPIFYSLNMVKERFSEIFFKIYIYNPFVGLLSLCRIATLKGFYASIQTDLGILPLVIIPTIFSLGVLFIGFTLYERNKDIINDYLSY